MRPVFTVEVAVKNTSTLLNPLSFPDRNLFVLIRNKMKIIEENTVKIPALRYQIIDPVGNIVYQIALWPKIYYYSFHDFYGNKNVFLRQNFSFNAGVWLIKRNSFVFCFAVFGSYF